MVIGVPIKREVEKPQILSRGSSLDSGGGNENENQAMPRKGISVRGHGEDERSGERVGGRGIRRLSGDFGRVQSAADGEIGLVGESDERGFDGGVAVEGDGGGIEAIEEKIDGGNGGEKKKGEREEEKWEFEYGHGSREKQRKMEKEEE